MQPKVKEDLTVLLQTYLLLSEWTDRRGFTLPKSRLSFFGDLLNARRSLERACWILAAEAGPPWSLAGSLKELASVLNLTSPISTPPSPMSTALSEAP